MNLVVVLVFMLKWMEWFTYISWHGYLYRAFFIVPLKLYANIKLSLPVCGDLVLFFLRWFKVLVMVFSCIFNTKIIDNNGEINLATIVCLYPRDIFWVWYPQGARCWTWESCIIYPACESPYTPLFNHANKYPLCTLYLILCLIIHN